jgi:hypothetical protein
MEEWSNSGRFVRDCGSTSQNVAPAGSRQLYQSESLSLMKRAFAEVVKTTSSRLSLSNFSASAQFARFGRCCARSGEATDANRNATRMDRSRGVCILAALR